MQHLAMIICLVLAVLFSACDRQQPAADVDPGLGRECYERHRASLAPGTQYEGIETLADNTLTIRLMDGVQVVTLECALNPDGTLQGGGDY